MPILSRRCIVALVGLYIILAGFWISLSDRFLLSLTTDPKAVVRNNTVQWTLPPEYPGDTLPTEQ